MCEVNECIFQSFHFSFFIFCVCGVCITLSKKDEEHSLSRSEHDSLHPHHHAKSRSTNDVAGEDGLNSFSLAMIDQIRDPSTEPGSNDGGLEPEFYTVEFKTRPFGLTLNAFDEPSQIGAVVVTNHNVSDSYIAAYSRIVSINGDRCKKYKFRRIKELCRNATLPAFIKFQSVFCMFLCARMPFVDFISKYICPNTARSAATFDCTKRECQSASQYIS